jgi:hypothetical protein
MRYATDHTQLGPDPEPPTLRFGALMRAAVPRRAPVSCPLEAALGSDVPCRHGECPFYRVRGVEPACAVEAWSPTVRERLDVARWYRRRRDAITRRRRPETPGQAHARRARSCADAHARTVSALRELDRAIRRGERWCDDLAHDLEDADARSRELRVRLHRRQH